MTHGRHGDATQGKDPVLTVRGLDVTYAAEQPVRAVRDVDLTLRRGQVLGLAGESGCGKSTLAYALCRLLRPPAETDAREVTFHETDGTRVNVFGLTGPSLRAFRWKKVAMVFQSAMNALNPVLSVRAQLADVLAAHEPGSSAGQRRQRCAQLLTMVGIDPARLSSYPHELSGGMRQRVMVAMALALNPDVVIMDEPTTALDVVVQREILDEIDRLRSELGFAVIFITHDLSLLLEISDRIAVMYGGRIVEEAPADGILDEPRHPYTVGLRASFPSLTGERREHLHGIPGRPPDLSRPGHGCLFAPRCPYRREVCDRLDPELTAQEAAAGHHRAACHAYDPARYGEQVPEALAAGEFLPVEAAEVMDR